MSAVCENCIFLFLLQILLLEEHLREETLGSSQTLICIYM